MSLQDKTRAIFERYAPFGVLARKKPRHFLAVLRTLRETHGSWHKAWQMLNGPCNGCAVQTDGLRDNVLPNSPHFCLVRLGLLEEALRKDAPPRAFADAAKIRKLGNDRIERIGRLTSPLLWRRGGKGYEPISFDDAYALAGGWITEQRGDACGFFTTSKAVGNEEYYAFQQFARVVGFTNNVDSCARQCHAASVTALKATVGAGVSSGTLSDFMNTDVLVLAGTNLANNQPLVMRYIERGRATRGGRPYVIVVNPYREPGLDRYWVPSSVRSALFGSKICDEYVPVRIGGDIAFFNGVLKVLIEDALLTDKHRTFIQTRTSEFEGVAELLAKSSLDELAGAAGVPIEKIRRVAMVLARSENALFCWGMGLTQHRRGTDNIKAFVNLALATGQLGKPNAGVAPLRGQSGVQASGECGVAPNVFPGGAPVNESSAERFSEFWSAPLSAKPGLATGPMIEAAECGDIKLLMSLGGNLRETMPDRSFIEKTLRKTPYRIRLDVMMNSDALIEPGEASLIIPIRNWYEWDSVFTTTATDRTIRAFRGTIPRDHRDLPESWQALKQIAGRVLGSDASGFDYAHTQAIREMMDRTIGVYEGIADLSEPHRQMQWGGPYLFRNGFAGMPDNRARFATVEHDRTKTPAGYLTLTTRRGFGQWNSQHRVGANKDSLSSAVSRRDILMNPQDASDRSLVADQKIRLTTPAQASILGVCRPDADVRSGSVQAFWPLANDLIPLGIYDQPSTEPDYNVAVRIEPA